MAAEAPIKSIDIQDGGGDVLVGLPDLCHTFTGIADYLSLWCELYGLREQNIRVGHVEWKDEHTLKFKITDHRGSAISPLRYDPRMPENRHALRARPERLRRFVRMSPWFRRQLELVDREVRAYLVAQQLEPSDVETINRWTEDGLVLVRIIWKITPATRRRYMTHLKYGDERT